MPAGPLNGLLNELRAVVEKMVKDRFRKRASWPKRDIETIDNWVKKGRAQLTELRQQQIESVGVFRVRDSLLEPQGKAGQ